MPKLQLVLVKAPKKKVSRYYFRHVSTGLTGATAVSPRFSDTLTLSPPGGGGRFCPPSQRSQLNVPWGYVPVFLKSAFPRYNSSESADFKERLKVVRAKWPSRLRCQFQSQLVMGGSLKPGAAEICYSLSFREFQQKLALLVGLTMQSWKWRWAYLI